MKQVLIRPEVRRNDPLLYDFPLPHRAAHFPMGFAASVSTNSREVLDCAAALWGPYSDEFGSAPIELRIAVEEGSTAERPAPVMPRGQGHLVAIVHSPDNYAMADCARGYAFARITPAVLADRGYFQYYFLEPLACVMLHCLYLAPIHAACVALDGEGVLLCGESGAGKTSLAYACAQRGWTYVADDASQVIREGAPRRIVGRPHSIRFRSSAIELFPELAKCPAAVRANGKLDIEARTADLGLTSVALETRADYLVFLRRDRSSPPGLKSFSPEDAFAWMSQMLCVGTEDVRRQQRDSLRTLLRVPVLELRYSDLNDAEQRLRRLVRSGG